MEALPIVYAMATSMSGIVPWQQKHVGQIWGWIYRLTTHTMLFCFLDDLIPFGGHLHSASAVHSGNRPQNMRRWVIDSGIQRCDICAVAGVCNWHRWEWHGEGPSARMLEFKCATSQRPLVNFFTRNGQQLNNGNRSEYIELNTFQTRALPQRAEFVSKNIFHSKSPQLPQSNPLCPVPSAMSLLGPCCWSSLSFAHGSLGGSRKTPYHPSSRLEDFWLQTQWVSRTFYGDWSFLSAPGVLFFKGSPPLCHCLSLPLPAKKGVVPHVVSRNMSSHAALL